MIDTNMVDPFDLAGVEGAIRFTASAPAGSVIATLRMGQFDGRGGCTFSTFGTIPPQLAIVDGKIVRGSAAATPGQIYRIGVRMTAVDDTAGQGVTLSLRAT